MWAHHNIAQTGIIEIITTCNVEGGLKYQYEQVFIAVLYLPFAETISLHNFHQLTHTAAHFRKQHYKLKVGLFYVSTAAKYVQYNLIPSRHPFL